MKRLKARSFGLDAMTPKSILTLVALGIVVTFSPANSAAKAEQRIFAMELTLRLTKDESGGYNNFVKKLQTRSGQKMRLDYAPLRRNISNWLAHGEGCVFPTSIDTLMSLPYVTNDPAEFVASARIDYVSIYFYANQSWKVVDNLEALNDKIIGHIHESVGIYLLGDASPKLAAVTTDGQLLQMLQRNRLDLVMGFHPDFPIAVDRIQNNVDLFHSKDLAIFKAPMSFVCFNKPGIQDFLVDIDRSILEMRANGEAQELLGRHAEIVPLTDADRAMLSNSQ